ncbi:MAG: GNAT family N-acetyltransferase [Actinomycetia bacterium]|nr:GNAT family N-acetyltransferase [Actinomycetes bacterium]
MAKHLHSRPRRTPRFIIRPFRRRDVGPMHDAVRASLPELEEWLPWAIGYDRSVAHRFVRDSASAWNDARAYDFAVRLHEEPDFHVGNISVWPTSPANRVGEIGYWIRSDLTGEGIGTEVTARTVQVGFEELNYHKIILRIAVGNERSDRIAKRLGFTFEGTLRDEVKVGTTWIDHTSWSLLEEEWPDVRDGLIADGVLEERGGR